MRRISLVIILIVSSAAFSPQPARADEVGSSMAEAARRFVATLDPEQKSRATFSFDSPERVNWHWIPRERKGLPIKVMKPEQRAMAFGLLSTGLSTKGMIKATTIMRLEQILLVEEHGTGPVRDPELYFVSIFGNPNDDGEWGWRIEGHHLALNFTLKGGQVISATPFMFGSNPAEVHTGPMKGVKNLGEIESPTNKLILSLSPEQRKEAIVSPTAPDVTTTPNSARAPVSTPEGIAVTKLDADQKQTLTRLLHAYASNFVDPVRAELLEQFSRDPESIHFAWYGSTDQTKPHAFRVQSSAFLIDFNDTQNETNHIHTFYRSFLDDFGLTSPR
jgi:hypothetical protein